ncbi:tRNA-uridine aminocarboxypropyltransferase [Thalassotalea crassostreae]|uniref:tRNA-uridine aminocarboxypropyltransferase n=1 Tax=Thalassotalea crassostreae TaxID=1763536 RepID=UPI000838E794|nr:tRNA-uridine aminocarboxypropyltransferase [Thalassotalea crassostreae]
MSRQYCTSCERPLVTCICDLVSPIDNQVEIWFLQHPSEEKQTKGTARLAFLSLNRCRIIVGEDFTNNETLNKVIADSNVNVCLLYPGNDAVVADKSSFDSASDTIVLVLDGTWKKAFKMYQLSKNLHGLPKLTLPSSITSNYVIRKHHKSTDLSSLEACTHLLIALEGDSVKFQPLLDSFDLFNQFQQRLVKLHSKTKS